MIMEFFAIILFFLAIAMLLDGITIRKLKSGKKKITLSIVLIILIVVLRLNLSLKMVVEEARRKCLLMESHIKN